MDRREFLKYTLATTALVIGAPLELLVPEAADKLIVTRYSGYWQRLDGTREPRIFSVPGTINKAAADDQVGPGAYGETVNLGSLKIYLDGLRFRPTS